MRESIVNNFNNFIDFKGVGSRMSHDIHATSWLLLSM